MRGRWRGSFKSDASLQSQFRQDEDVWGSRDSATIPGFGTRVSRNIEDKVVSGGRIGELVHMVAEIVERTVSHDLGNLSKRGWNWIDK